MEMIIAFVVGGLLCVLGQIIIDKTRLTPARIMVGYVVAGVVLAGIGIYDMLVDFAGAGVTVPLLGFGNCLATGAREAMDKDGVLGIFTGALTASAGGIGAAVLFGYLNAMVFRSRTK